MQQWTWAALAATAAVLAAGGVSRAAVRLPSIFSEGMVLQRDVKVPVWGAAEAGEKVTVTVYDRDKVLAKAETAAAPDGTWRVELDPLPTGGRYTLLVQGAENMVMFTDVLVGEVWLVCGQSNMMFPVESSAARDEAVAERHKYPNIRVAAIGRRKPHEVTEPQTDTEGYWGPVKWEHATYTVPRSSRTDVPGSSSAVSYYFARELYDYLGGKVPVGMLEVGAIQRVESWVDEQTVKQTPQLAPLAGKPYPHATSRSFNANIAPLAPYPVRGAIYYQGEMNAGDGATYGHGLTGLIRSWRKAWGREDMPFLIVQLPGFIKHEQERHELDMDEAILAKFRGRNVDHGFCDVREAQLCVAETVSRTWMAVTIDLGEPFNIHPPRKKPVAGRLFRLARKHVYGDDDVVADSPVPESVRPSDGGLRITFRNVGEGLKVRGDSLEGFELAGEDGKWVEAKAEIVAPDAVKVSAGSAAGPQAVRYAWRGYPPVTLYNSADLPATPFRRPVPAKETK